MAGILAGALGGLIASWTMERFQAAWSEAQQQVGRQRVLAREGSGRRRGAKGGPEDPARMDLPEHGGGEEPSTVKVASAVAEPVLERELTEEEKPVAGEAVHYAFGTFNGALYGAIADVLPPARAGGGMLFGAVLWLVADELMLWKLGLAKRPTEFPTATHAYALASHLVYGLTLEAVRRTVRALV